MTTTGTFAGGEALVGVDTGVVLTADANPADLDDDNVAGTFSTVTATDNSLPGTLFSVANAALGADEMRSISTLEFKIQPSAQFLKLTYSLVISESGSYDAQADTWGSSVFNYPDGVGIFVKEAGTNWAANQNCAVIPTTSTYLAMETAGIVPLTGTVPERRVLAQANYDTLVAPTLVSGYVPPATLPTVATNPVAPQIAPPRVAYATDGELGIGDEFITVPLTCVVDVSGFTGQVEVGIIIANFNDGAVPPALLIAGNSVGFAGNQSAVPVAAAVQPEVLQTTPYVGPTSDLKVYGAASANVALTGKLLETVSKMTIEGIEVAFTRRDDGSLAFQIPATLQAGTYDIILQSDYGILTLQEHLVIRGGVVALKGKPSTKKVDLDTVKIYYFNPEGAGKIQFFVDGKEIAWHQSNGTSSKGAAVARANNINYLVRTVSLSPGKNRVEIRVDGKRVWQATYVPKG
jgi:hypothetical protein